MKILGKELTFNGNKVYHAGNKPTAYEIGAIGADTSGNYVGMTASDGNKSNWIRTTTSGIIPSNQNKESSIGTSSWQFKAMYASTFYGALSGNASTATKLATAKTISLSGDVTGSVSFDGSANATISATNRRCVVGQTSNTTTNPYYKFATITLSATNSDREIVFKVSTGYSNNNASGILRAHFRTTADGLLDNAQFYWEYANIGIDPAKFIMAHSTTTPLIVELWAKIDSSYLHYHFDVLQEHDRGNSRARWTLFDTCTAGSANAITSGYTQIISSRLNIANSITGNANTATTLQTARTINGTSFNGGGNITTSLWGTARNITIGNTKKSVNGSADVTWTLSEIGAADASKLLPLTGGTLTGRLTANGKISMPTTSGSWINGKTITNAAIAVTTTQTSGSYHPVLAVKTTASHVVNLGGINNEFGFYGYYANRTENGTDWYFKFDVGSGTINHSGTLNSSRFISTAAGSASFLEKWYSGGKTARIDYYQNPNRLELFWSASNNSSDWTWANTIYFDENGTVKARTFNVNGCKMSYDTASPDNVQFIRPDGAEYAQVTCRSLNIGAYSGVTKKLSIESSAPASPKTGDVWIQV